MSPAHPRRPLLERSLAALGLLPAGGDSPPEPAAGLLAVLVMTVQDIDASVKRLLGVAGQVGANTANIPQLTATAPVLGQIVEEAVVQDAYMNALTDGFGGGQ